MYWCPLVSFSSSFLCVRVISFLVLASMPPCAQGGLKHSLAVLSIQECSLALFCWLHCLSVRQLRRRLRLRLPSRLVNRNAPLVRTPTPHLMLPPRKKRKSADNTECAENIEHREQSAQSRVRKVRRAQKRMHSTRYHSHLLLIETLLSLLNSMKPSTTVSSRTRNWTWARSAGLCTAQKMGETVQTKRHVCWHVQNGLTGLVHECILLAVISIIVCRHGQWNWMGCWLCL